MGTGVTAAPEWPVMGSLKLSSVENGLHSFVICWRYAPRIRGVHRGESCDSRCLAALKHERSG